MAVSVKDIKLLVYIMLTGGDTVVSNVVDGL